MQPIRDAPRKHALAPTGRFSWHSVQCFVFCWGGFLFFFFFSLWVCCTTAFIALSLSSSVLSCFVLFCLVFASLCIVLSCLTLPRLAFSVFSISDTRAPYSLVLTSSRFLSPLPSLLSLTSVSARDLLRPPPAVLCHETISFFCCCLSAAGGNGLR